MSTAKSRLRIPAKAVLEWPWLGAALDHAASRAGGRVEAGADDGSLLTWTFSRLSAAELKPGIDYALAWDEPCRAWRSSSSYQQFNFHQLHGVPDAPWDWPDDDDTWVYVQAPLDLSIVELVDPPRADVERRAQLNVRHAVVRLARQLGMAAPPLPRVLD